MIRGDHFKISITSNSSKHLESAMHLVFAEIKQATHYKIGKYIEKNGKDTTALWLAVPWDKNNSQYSKDGWAMLPYPLDVNNAVHFVQGWLNSVERDDNQYPDVDGTVEPDAFTVKTPVGPGFNQNEVFCMIIPTYSIYHK